MKNTKIWGVRAGLIGDTLIGLTILDHIKEKYPDSYVNWVIHRKNSQAAPLYIAQKNIDKIHITEGWESLGENDQALKASCDIQINEAPPVGDPLWFNKISTVEKNFQMVGINDLIPEDKQFPTLKKWWVDISTLHSPDNHGYSQFESVNNEKKKSIAIFPFAHYGGGGKRSPTKEWWEAVLHGLQDYEINHFGWVTEPDIVGTTNKFTETSLFDQIRLALESDIVIGSDAGTMWIMGAYSHPAINIMTYHFNGHNDNPMAFEPKNRNGETFFNPDHCNRVNPNHVIDRVREKLNEGIG